MTLDYRYVRYLEGKFPNAIIEGPIDGCVWIRTRQWMIEPEQMTTLRELGLDIGFIMTEGPFISIIIDKDTSKKVMIK